MIADDRLQTVLRMDSSTPIGARVQYLQILDILAQHSGIDPRWQAVGLARMHALRQHVAAEDRARHISSMGMRITSPALVRYLSADVPAVTSAVVRAARFSDEEWLALLPNLPVRARGFLRNRRDLGATVERALANYGATDWVLPQTAAEVVAAQQAIPHLAAGKPVTTGVDEPAIPLPVVSEPLVTGTSDAGPYPVEKSLPTLAQSYSDAAQVRFVEELIAETPPVDAPDQPTNEIREILRRIEEFRRSRPEFAPEAPLLPLDSFETRDNEMPARVDFETDAQGAFTWVKGARGLATPLIGAAPFSAHAIGVAINADAGVKSAFSRRSVIQSGQVQIASPPMLKGQWRVDAQPFFEPVSGRFLGYRGRLRRPRFEESPRPNALAEQSADSFRQLMHELKTPLNAIAGFSDVIAEQLFGPADTAYREMARNIGRDANQLLRDFEDIDGAIRRYEDRGYGSSDNAPVGEWMASLSRQFTPDKVSFRLIGDGGDVNRFVIANRTQADRAMSRVFSAVLPELANLPAQCVARFSHRRLDIDIPVPDQWESMSAQEILSGKNVESDGQTHAGRAFALRLAKAMAEQIDGGLLVSGSRLCLTLPCMTTSRKEVASEVQG